MQKTTEVKSTTNSAKKTPVRYAFLYCNSPITQRQYPERLKIFFDSVGIPGNDLEEQGQAFLDQARQDAGDEWANQQIMEYVDHLRQRVFKKEISPSTLKTMLQPIKTFTHAFRDVHQSIDWERITKSTPKEKRFSGDRIPTLEELRKVIEYPDRRIRAVVYTMCSSGIRIGAWQYLKWKHITPVYSPKNDKEVIAAKIVVYASEPEEHISFITPEAYHELEKYKEFRRLYGEKITGESWVLRDFFKTADVKRKSPVGGNYGKATEPKQISEKALSRVLIRAWHEQGIRDILDEGGRGAVRRHEFKTAHSFRKYFKTRAEQVMNRLNVEYLLGHTVGMNSNYYRPTEQELLTDYLRAVPALTISEDFTNIKKQQEILEKRQEDKDKEIQELKLQQQNNNKQLQTVIELLGDLLTKAGPLDPKDIKWPLIYVHDYFEDNKGDGAGLAVMRNILRIREENNKNKEK